MKNFLFTILLPLFTYCQTIKVSITKAEINDYGLGTSLALEYRPDSLKIDGISQARIKEAKIIFSDGSLSKLKFSEYYQIANPNPLSVIFFNPPKKKVTNIKSLIGKIEYYTPTIENGDIKILENPRTKINTRIFKDLLGFEFYIVDVNALIKLKNLNRSKRYTEAQKLIGLHNLSSDFKKSLDHFFKYLPISVIDKNGAFFYIFDPSDSFFTIRIINENGELQNTNYSSSSDLAWKYFQVTNYNSLDEKLAFIFHTKSSIREFDFNVSNIEIKKANGL